MDTCHRRSGEAARMPAGSMGPKKKKNQQKNKPHTERKRSWQPILKQAVAELAEVPWRTGCREQGMRERERKTDRQIGRGRTGSRRRIGRGKRCSRGPAPKGSLFIAGSHWVHHTDDAISPTDRVQRFAAG
ncbi:unnamed protein product [Lepidochelys olivacea]